MGKDTIPVIEDMKASLKEHFDEETFNMSKTFILNNKHNQVTSTYYLLMKRKERETGRNYVFE